MFFGALNILSGENSTYSMKITERNPKNSNEKRKTKTKSKKCKKCKNGEREYFFESQNV